jgi:response regulator RpfG family c-di-GMP phosphodiesterase
MTSPNLIVIIDPEVKLLGAVNRVLANYDVRYLHFEDILPARRKIISDPPALIISKVNFPTGDSAGTNFCKELTSHPTLQKVPVLLVTELPVTGELSEEQLRSAHEAGAKGLIKQIIPDDQLLHRILGLLPTLKNTETTNIENNPNQDKLNYVQQLLAKVLHNLKTSDLMTIAEYEDVPRIVLEMTRSVCDINKGDVTKGQEFASERERTSNLDLDQLFKRG